MKRYIFVVALSLAFGMALAPTAQAQVFVRAPFVRVEVGGGVYVRAPFVNLWVPPAPVLYGPPGVFMRPIQRIVESPAPQYIEPQPQQAPLPIPQREQAPNNEINLPPPTKISQVPSLDQFAKTFQPKGGNYDVNILNPVTNQATHVKFSLPEGNPRNVHVRQNEIEFDYGIRRFVRIEFDNDGAMVTSR